MSVAGEADSVATGSASGNEATAVGALPTAQTSPAATSTDSVRSGGGGGSSTDNLIRTAAPPPLNAREAPLVAGRADSHGLVGVLG